MTQDLTSALLAYIQNDLLRSQPVSASDDLLMSGLIDSMAVMSLVAEVERLSGRSVPAQDVTIENFVSVDAITAYLARAEG